MISITGAKHALVYCQIGSDQTTSWLPAAPAAGVTAAIEADSKKPIIRKERMERGGLGPLSIAGSSCYLCHVARCHVVRPGLQETSGSVTSNRDDETENRGSGARRFNSQSCE